MLVKEKRAMVIELHHQGKTPPEIFRELKNFKINRIIIKRTLDRFFETFSINDRPRSGRKRSVTTKKLVKAVRERIKRNPRRCLRKMAVEMNVNLEVMRKLVKDKLKIKCYKLQKVAGLSEAQKEKRLKRCKQLLKRYDDNDVKRILFSDEKLFVTEQQINKQNHRILATNIREIPINIKTVKKWQYSASLMVWAGVSLKGKTNLIFFKNGIKINAAKYIEDVLEHQVKCLNQTMFNNQGFVFQQDSAPAHKAKVTQAWCNENLPEFIHHDEWPPSSPDLNTMDYFVWGYLQDVINSSHCQSIEELKHRLIVAWGNLDLDKVHAAINSWRKRLRLCVKAKGNSFEINETNNI